MKLILILSIILISLQINAQSTFQIALGNTAREYPHGMVLTNDGNYLIAGDEFTPGINYQLIVSKITPTGTVMWSKKIGTPRDDRAQGIAKTITGGYALAATTPLITQKIYVANITADANLNWAKMYGTDTTSERAYDIKSTSDGGFIIAAETDVITPNNTVGNIDMCLTKLDAMGNLQWMKAYTPQGSGFNAEGIERVIQLADGSYTAAGEISTTSGIYGVGVIHVSATGTPIWCKQYFLPTFHFTNAKGLVATPDGGYMITGRCASPDSSNIFVMKIDANGNQLFFKKYGSIYQGWANQIIRATDGNYVISGTDQAGPVVGTDNQILLRVNESGVMQSLNTFGGLNDEMNLGGVLQTVDGGYILSASSNSYSNGDLQDYDMFITKVNVTRSAGIICNNITPTFTTQTLNPIVTSFVVNETAFGAAINNTNTTVTNVTLANEVGCLVPIVLPIDNVVLKATLNINNTATVNWALEKTDVKNYSLQKAVNSTNEFTSIFSENANAYLKNNFIDNGLFGKTFYRLKVEKNNGSIVYSNIAEINAAKIKQNIVQIFPNPITSKATIYLNQLSNGENIFNIQDFTGKNVFSEIVKSNSTITFDRNNLANGVYFYTLKNNSGIITAGKIVLQ